MSCPCCMRTQAPSSCVIIPVELTDREREISLLLIERKAPAEIANKLTIEKRTVYAHLANIANKLNSKTRRASTLTATLSAITYAGTTQI